MPTRRLLGVLFLTMAAASPALAQVPGQGGPPDFAQMRQQFLDRMKEMLGASDDEWKALQPKIEKVQQLQRETSGMRGMFMMMFGPGGPGGPPPGGPPPGAVIRGGPDGAQPPSPIQQKMQDLRAVLDNKDSTPEEIKARLQALRDARAQAKADLAKAQDDLRDLLTTRQESVLVMMGMLD